jgi:hypothetical protein
LTHAGAASGWSGWGAPGASSPASDAVVPAPLSSPLGAGPASLLAGVPPLDEPVPGVGEGRPAPESAADPLLDIAAGWTGGPCVVPSVPAAQAAVTIASVKSEERHAAFTPNP